MNLKKVIICLSLMGSILLISCTEKEEPCIKTICPDGFNNCIDVPCDYTE